MHRAVFSFKRLQSCRVASDVDVWDLLLVECFRTDVQRTPVCRHKIPGVPSNF